ncbi:MAG: glycosyltransferase family 4 protein [Candidatus Cloacimonetes bacterium]|jgi:glycosyltransferase involved in cell wall biosynthesis|nr:glycosyltransferase family 4 protein [Candidatus Cloacimonadota bacterium]
MKIFFIDPNNTTPRLNYPLLESFRKKGIEVTLFTSWNQKTEYYDRTYDVKPNYCFFQKSNKIQNKYIRRFLKFFSYPPTLKIIAKKAILDKPDLVHINWLVFPKIELNFIRKLHKAGIKVILTQHNYFQHDTNKLKPGEMDIFQTVDKIICLSNYVASQFPAELQDKIITIEHGNCFSLELQNFKPNAIISSNSKKGVFAGGISYYKGLDLLIKAVVLLKSKNKLPELIIRIIGNGERSYANYIKNMITRSGLNQEIIFENRFVSYEELLEEIVKADFGIMPYRSATQSGLPYLFASLYKPLLVTDVGGLSEQVDPAFALIVKPSAADLAGGLVQLSSTLSAYSKENFENFNNNNQWVSTVNKYVEAYQEMK